MTPCNGQTHGDIVKLRRSKWIRKGKFFGSNFFLYLAGGTGNFIENEIPSTYSIDLDPTSFQETMESQDAFFLEKSSQDQMDLIMRNDTWILIDFRMFKYQDCFPLATPFKPTY